MVKVQYGPYYILAFLLKTQGRPLTLEELLALFIEFRREHDIDLTDLSTEAINPTVWQLVDDGLAEFTMKWYIRYIGP